MQSQVGSRAMQKARPQKKNKKLADGLLTSAFSAYREGRHAEVQALCRRVLGELPDHFDALHLLGVSTLDCGRFQEAEDILAQAMRLDQRSADACSNFGLVCFKLKRYDEARIWQERAIALRPDFPTALTNLGNTLMSLRLFEQAVETHDRAIRLKPDYAEAYCNRGMAQLLLNRNEEANQSFDRALSFRPQHVEAIFGQGIANLNLRRFDAAAAAFNRALAIKPDMAEVLAHRGRMHLQLARFAEATADFNAALALSPELEAAWRGLAQVAILTGKITQAMVACKRVLAQNPNCETGLTLLGTCLGSQGETASAIAHFDRALAIKPDYEEAITKKIFALDFLPDADFAIQQAARRYWWDAIGARIPQRQLSPRQLDPNRRLVVGYVSSDFRSHSAAFAFMPVLRHHDRTNFSVVCYACSPQQDAVTEGLRAYADIWVDAWHLPDDDLADRIQADNVDILVDLSGHTAGHRLPVFARKPAPVQVTAWGSGTGTGLPTMDYFLADPVTVPQSVRHFFAERVYDLPSVITMEPIRDMRPSAPPMIRNGYITFGVFNRIDKISEAALKVWAKLLQAVVGSKIIVKHGALDDELVRDGLIARFVAQGVSLDSITCIGATWRGEHLSTFEKVDISLDPFPQNGGISTWESLYMGVPVVAKLGNGASSRAAGAILKAIGLDDWVAEDDDGYIAIARKFASMPSHLEKLRAELPAKIASSAAGNVETYTCKVEEGYRQFWRGYCAEASEAGAKP